MKVKFKGPLQGQPFAIKAAGKAGSTPAWGSPPPVGNPAVTITKIEAGDFAAPRGVWFEATVTGFDLVQPDGSTIYDPNFHELEYHWTFGDPGTLGLDLRLPDYLKNRNRAQGQFCSHVFTAPGSYIVTCIVEHPQTGRTAEASTTVVVGEPIALYPASQTVLLASDGDFSGAPEAYATATKTTTWAAACDAARTKTGFSQILMKRGDTFDVSARSKIRERDGWKNFRLGSFGDPNLPRPILLKFFSMDDMDRSKNVTVFGVQMVGGWDPTTESGTSDNGLRWEGGHVSTYYDCKSSNCSISMGSVSTSYSGVFIGQELEVDGWKDYGFYFPGNGQKYGIKGLKVRQNVDANGAGMNKATPIPYNTHGPSRWTSHGENARAYIGACDMFSNAGWSTISAEASPTGNRPAHQACFRTTSGVEKDRIIFDGTVMEGGMSTIVFADTAGTAGFGVPTNCIVYGGMFIGTANTGSPIGIGYGAVTFRNPVVVLPDVPSEGRVRMNMISINDNKDDPRNAIEPVTITNATFIDLRSHGTENPGDMLGNDKPGALNIKVLDYVFHAPNRASPVASDGPLDTTVWADPLYKGLKWVLEPNLDATFATPAGTIATYAPLTQSPAIADASTRWSSLDWFGRKRPAAPSRGAIEADDRR